MHLDMRLCEHELGNWENMVVLGVVYVCLVTKNSVPYQEGMIEMGTPSLIHLPFWSTKPPLEFPV